MSVYDELDQVYSIYPTADNLARDKVIVPKAAKDQFKYGKYMKECMLTTASCGYQHRLKRCYLIQEMTTMLSIIQCNIET